MSWTPAPRYDANQMHNLFLADQLYALGLLGQGQVAPTATVGESAPPTVLHDLGHSVPPPLPQPTSSYVGWGGQAIPENGNYRVHYFGRNRNKGPHQRQRGGGKVDFVRAGDSLTAAGAHCVFGSAKSPEDAMSVEEAVKFVQRLPKAEPLPDRLFKALYSLDSRAVALLLKDLSKAGLDYRAVELFDWLRALGEKHALRQLCDVFTYTAMIYLCIYEQAVDRAMELMNDMVQRNIERNVHTYTALMNVCIKCGKLALALEIYGQMRVAGCTPNVVTYNTLIDVYGKLGQWEKALQVMECMKAEGVEPVLRTYNTLIIACNMCNQPREALSVYQQLLAEGFSPNSTTYNALISAYGKLGQLDKVLEVYKDMVWKGLERGVITYSSLISACEKAGRWETALELFEEMQREGCKPNTVTYNSLITACAQGVQWEKAREVFEQMQAQCCTPDVVTYTALISAYERGGQWQLALQSFHQMCSRGCRPDAIVYNAIIDALWETGVTWVQSKALQLYKQAVSQGHFKQEGSDPAKAELNLHALTAGVAMLSLYSWLARFRQLATTSGESALPANFAIITDAGHASREQGNFIVKEAVAAMMSFWGAPFKTVQDEQYAGVLQASRSQVASWLLSSSFKGQMSSLFPITEPTTCGDNFEIDQGAFDRDNEIRESCVEAFAAVKHFEDTHCLALQNMGLNYLQQRSALVHQLLNYGSKLNLKDEVVHDAVLLLDRTVSAANTVNDEVLPLLATAVLKLSCKQSGPMCCPSDAQFEEVSGLPTAAVAEMLWSVRKVLSDDTSAIPSLRCLKMYLERMCYRFQDRAGMYGIAGLPIMMVVESLFEVSLLNCRPSVVAAALLYAERRQRGAVPFWPSTLAKLTGYEDLTSPELAVAVRTAQKLCRKVVYPQIFKAYVTWLHGDEGTPEAQPDLLVPPLPFDVLQQSRVQASQLAEGLQALSMAPLGN